MRELRNCYMVVAVVDGWGFSTRNRGAKKESDEDTAK